MFSRMVLYRTLEGLARMVREPEYVEAGRNSEERVLFEGILADDERGRAILKARLLEYCKDEGRIERIAGDKTLVNAIIDGKKPGQPSALEILRSHLGSSRS